MTNLKILLSRRHELDLARILPGAHRVAGSGSKRESHDVETLVTENNEWWRFRYEAKCTQKKSYSFKEAEWKDLVEDVYSRSSQERPAWAIRFYGEEASPGMGQVPVLQDLVVVDLNDWCELLVELESLRGQGKHLP